MPIDRTRYVDNDYAAEQTSLYLKGKDLHPLFLCGDSYHVLEAVPANSVECCITSPPYWGHREYAEVGIGLEDNPEEYINNLVDIMGKVCRVMKPAGSIWLNIGDTYRNKNLLGIPWRVALRCISDHSLILRNDIIWNKIKGGPDNSKDKLRNVHEHVFHFVLNRTYYYNADAIRSKPRSSKVVNGRVVSATGVSGVRYKRQIELSTSLTSEEKRNAFEELEKNLDSIQNGEISDFRMIIRNQQRTTHSDSSKVSGRAKELIEKGFYFLKYHPKGTKPSDVWDILPEDSQRGGPHYAPFPEDICRIPILSTSTEGGLVLDPFAGTGTAMLVSYELGRKSIGIDNSFEYMEEAVKRCSILI